MHVRARLGLAPVALFAIACSSSSAPVPRVSAAETLAFSRATNIIPVEISVGGATGMAIVDTGDPFVLLDSSSFPEAASLQQTGGNVPSIQIGGATAKNVFVLPTAAAALTSPDSSFQIDANLGYTGIGAFVAAFNYRDVMFAMGSVAPAPPTGLLAESVVSFSLEGGETLDGIKVPRSRIVVTVTIEKTDYRMLVDTGASYVTISGTAFATITSDGRTQMSGGTVETTTGASTSSLTRVASMVVGGVEVQNVVIATDPSFDTNLAAIGTDAGETIDGSLGGTYLHDFYVTVDYPSGKLHLARYANLDFALDPAERIGLMLQQSGDGYSVASVSTTAAADGVKVGDTVVSIDGVALSGLTVSEAGVAIFGKVGTLKKVTLGSSAQAGGHTVSLPVEELLPLH